METKKLDKLFKLIDKNTDSIDESVKLFKQICKLIAIEIPKGFIKGIYDKYI